MTTAYLESGASVSANRWVANQAGSSASQVEKMVLRELRAGDFSKVPVRLERIEQLVSVHLLGAEDERRLLLLGARFLEAAGETRKARRIVGALLSDRDTLQGEFYADLRRFRTRLVLNAGDIDNARWEIDRIERVVTETTESFGAVMEVVDNSDVSLVSSQTWLLEAEVCLEEGNVKRGLQCLANALRSMQSGVSSPAETAMFELLSAVLLLMSGDDSAVPALAYLYRTYVGMADSVESCIRARIAAVVGDLKNVAGISETEVRRWRRYGPRYDLVSRFLVDDVTLISPIDFSAHLPVAQIVAAPVSHSLEISEETVVEGRRGPESGIEFPMSFLFSAHGLEEIATHFDYHLKTGPVVIDWSQCDRGLIEDAIQGGAIAAIALRCERGIVYFNNGSYVDALFDGLERDDVGLSVEDVIFELFRISMAGLPGAFGRQLVSGPEGARIPEVVNYRPNSLNIDLMRRLDHLRSGGSLEDIEDTDIEAAFASWPGESPAAEVTAPVELVGLSDVAAESDHVFLGSLLSLTEAASVESVYTHLCSAVATLGLEEPFIGINVAGSGEPLFEAGSLPKEYVVWAKSNGGPVCVELSLRSGLEANCRESVQLLLNAATQRLRLMPGVELAGRVELPEFVAEDLVTQSLLSNLRHYALLDGVNQPAKAILLTGERGTGKELLAKALHNWSGRSGKSFRPVNFAEVSKALGAAALFGAKKGAYTGADTNRKGHIQEAEGGTLFLDELDEADENVQAMLKRLIQFGTYYQVGSPDELRADVRFVAATNVVGAESSIKRDLRDRFLEVRVPPLRERRGDIRPLAALFAARLPKAYSLPDSVLCFLETLDWPGNVRQLETVVVRSCAVIDSADELTLELFEKSAIEERARVVSSENLGGEYAPLTVGETLKMRRKKVDVFHITRVVRECNGNLKHAAERLGMTQPGLKDRMKELNIPKHV